MAWKKLLFVAITALILPGFKAAEGEENFAVELTVETFDEAIAKNNHFVKFFAPWDGYTKVLNPTWELLAKTMNFEDNPRVIIANVDCTKHEILCTKNKIRGYPRLVFFKLGEKEPVNFGGIQKMTVLEEFIEEVLKEKNKYYSPVIVKGKPVLLNKLTFHKYVASGKHFIYINTFSRQEFETYAPLWDDLAKSLENETAISIAKIDSYKTVFEVEKIHVFFWYEDGKKIEEYSGPLTHDDLHAYVKDMLKINENLKKLQVQQLTADNFKPAIANGVTFVNFYVTSCRKCEQMNAIWNQLAEKIHSSDKGIKIAKIDCTYADNKELCADQKIEDFPSLIAYKNGERRGEYNLSLTELVRYIRSLVGHEEL